MVTIWTSPGGRICFCATLSCSLGDSKLICPLFYHRIFALPERTRACCNLVGVGGAGQHTPPPYPSTDAAQNVVGDGPGDFGELLRVDGTFALGTQQPDFIAGSELGGVAEVDGGEVHRNRTQDGSESAVGDHLPAIPQAVKYAIRVPRPEDADAHGARRAVAAAISHQGAFGNFLHGE